MKRTGPSSPASPSAAKKARGFTLVEIITSATVAGLVLASVAVILVLSVRLVNKNHQIDSAVTNTRLVQEHINGEMAVAISQTKPVLIRPTFSSASTTTPVRYAAMTYRVPVGSFGTVHSDTSNTSSSIDIDCPPDVVPKVGDYFLMDAPNLDGGIRVTGVSAGGTSGSTTAYTITLASTLLAGTDSHDTPVNALTGKLVRIQRERKYETIAPSPTTSPVTELHWYESTIDATYVVLSKNVDANARYLFAQIPLDPSPTTPADEPSVSWQFSFVSSSTSGSNGTGTYNQGGDKSFYQSNYAEGLIMPKSGNPLSATSILGGSPTLQSTTTYESTTTMGTTTYESTTTFESTTTLGTTTYRSTTTLGTTTTTTLGTSTTRVSTTTLGTSTTRVSTTTLGTTTAGTTLRTTTAGTTTMGTSTTIRSTTTTKASTTTTKASTTTAGTSTTAQTTLRTTTAGTSTTRQSTTTMGTSTTAQTTLRTTTAGTTTAGTSTTRVSTTTVGVSTTLRTTTTLGTSTTAKTTTTISTTTSIPFDG